jgi:hypothetical protein
MCHTFAGEAEFSQIHVLESFISALTEIVKAGKRRRVTNYLEFIARVTAHIPDKG